MPPCRIDADASRVFCEQVRRLSKKYPRLLDDLKAAFARIERDYTTACHANRVPGVGAEVWKYRHALTDQAKGSRGGLRLVVYRHGPTNTLYPLLVYVKSETEDFAPDVIASEARALREQLRDS